MGWERIVPRSDHILTANPTVVAHDRKFAPASLIGEVLTGRRLVRVADVPGR